MGKVGVEKFLVVFRVGFRFEVFVKKSENVRWDDEIRLVRSVDLCCG